ncbi:macrophage mannose receptor 1-like [Paralichthys olivaceus]|uniref:macrophage mannose receptor 1-like n=1 Tax=Paralichthys olivaceus TaxID=8255 RepID=UPI0037509966
MGNKSIPELTLPFLLTTALCLEATHIKNTFHFPSEKMTWTEARQYCQRTHIDLVTWNTVDRVKLSKWLVKIDVKEAWIGLHRDPEKDPVWKWINVKTGEGVAGHDLSQSSEWADGSQSGHCAVVRDDLMWYSVKCSSRYNVYCSRGSKTLHHEGNVSWHHASQLCQAFMSSLATITKANKDDLDNSGWIGLYRQAGHNWSWVGNSSSNYRNWAPGEPLTTDCGSYDPKTEKWYSKVCSQELEPVCYDDNLVVVNKNKTWEQARRHCTAMRTPCADSSDSCVYSYKMLSLHNLQDYDYVRERIYRASTDEVWIGLRYLAGEWRWMNGNKLDDQGMLPECPSLWKNCGTLSKHDTNNWISRDCSERRNFICQRRKMPIGKEKRN